MKLELKHLAPYLPYKLNICYRILDLENGNPNTDDPNDRLMDCIMIMDGARLERCLLPEIDRWYDKNSIFKPILRPLYDLLDTNTAKELNSISSFVFVYDLRYKTLSIQTDSELDIELNNMVDAINILYANHFDVFGLIDAGLAIDKTTVL